MRTWRRFAVGYLCLIAVMVHASDIRPVVIDYFYESGCPECRRVTQNVLPELESAYAGFYRLERHELGVVSNVVKLIAYQAANTVSENCPVSMFLDYTNALCGYARIRSGLSPLMDQLIEARLTPGWQSPEPIEWQADETPAADRANAFAVPAVMIAGFIDGINPCAISTLVFFMSMLVVAGVRGRGVLIMGGAFTLSAFTTYTAIGFGLLKSFHMLEAYPLFRSLFEGVLSALLVILAVFSFRDAVRYRRTRNPADVSLQLPGRIKTRIHAVLRTGARSHHLILAGAVTGALVTALETVCTGQVYVPTMALVIRDSGVDRVLQARVWGLLLLYNLMFIMPLLAAIVLTRYGLTTQRMLAISRQHVPFSKSILGVFFLAVALYLLIG